MPRPRPRRKADRRFRELEAMVAVAASAGRSADLTSAMLDSLAAVCDVTGMPTGAVYRLDRVTDELVLIASQGVPAELTRVVGRRPVAGSLMAEAIRSGALQVTRPSRARSLPASLRRIAAAQGHHRQFTLPIRVDGAPWGVLTLVGGDGPDLAKEEVQFLEGVADQVGVAVERASLLAEMEEKSRRLEALSQLARTVTASLPILEVLEAVCGTALSFFPGGAVQAWMLEDDRLISRAQRGFRTEQPGPLAVGQGMAGTAAATRRPAFAADVAHDPRVAYVGWIRDEGLASLVCLPLLARDRLVGVLAVFTREPHAFTQSEMELVMALADQAAVAIDNAELVAVAQRRAAEYRILNEVGQLVGATLDADRVLDLIVERCREVMGVGMAGIFRLDAPLQTLVYERGLGLSADFVRRLRVRMGEGTSGRAASERRPVWSRDVLDDPAIPVSDAVRVLVQREGYRGVLSVPIPIKGEPWGALAVYWLEPHEPRVPEIELLSGLAVQAGIAIDNARLYGELAGRLREASALLAVGRLLSRPDSPPEVMRRVAREVAQALGADMAGVCMVDDARARLVPLAGYRVPGELRRAFLDRPFVLSRFPRLLDDWRAGRAVWSADAHADPRMDPGVSEGLAPYSFLFAPTMVRGEPVGAIFLTWWTTGRVPRPDEIHLIEGVAAQMGLAIENAELARQTQARLQETETLLAVSRTLSSSLDGEAMPRQFLRQVCDALSADTAGIWLLPEGADLVQPLLGYHVPADKLRGFQALRLSVTEHAFLEEAVRTRRPVFAEEAARDPRLPPELRSVDPSWSFLWVPMITGDRVAGGFAVAWWGRVRRLSPGEVRVMEAVTTQVGVALENARLFRDHERRVHELSVLHELSRAVTGQLDQAEIIDTLGRQVVRVFEAQDVTILLDEPATATIAVALRVREGARDDGPPRGYPREACGLAAAVLAGGRPIRTDDYVAACVRHGIVPLGIARGMPHWIGVPMRGGDERLGVVCLRSGDRSFTETDERLLTNVADMAAVALRSARLFEERTRAYGDLAHAQEQLVLTERLRALGEMASGIAHDFNNLLASILGRAQLILEEIEDGKLRRWVKIIERAAMDGAETVRRLQEFTRIRRDQPFVPVAINRVVEDALEVTESRWRNEPRSRGVSIEVTVALASALPQVGGDPVELREVLTNLILNAVDAMPGGGALRLATREVDGQVELAVADTGLGMPEAVRQRIFDPFFTTKGQRGTGLGLSIAYGILSRHGAAVQVESEEGRGTTFILRFPPTTLAVERRPEPAVVRPGGPLRCLVVDDEDVVGDVLGDMLQAGGHQAVVTRNGVQALARFRAEPFDVVFSDLAMPGMSGWDVVKAVKELRPEVPVFLVTGFGVEVAPEQMREAGLEGLLAKPLRIQQLRDLLSHLVPRRV